VTLSPETLLATAPTRTTSVCLACGTEHDPADEPAPVHGCPEHGVELAEVECLRASAMGLEMPERNVPVAMPPRTTEQLIAAQRVQGEIDDKRRSQRLADQAKQDAVPSFFSGEQAA
jgi:hypothetical protein